MRHGVTLITPPAVTLLCVAAHAAQLKALGINDVLNFDFMDAPPRAAILR
jgi:ATP-dependent RNA helicase DHX8/PRP22